MDKLLERVYFNPKRVGSYGGVQGLYNAVKKHGISLEYVKNWLSKQDAYSIHKDTRIRFKRNKTYVDTFNQQYQGDLCDLRTLAKYNDNYKYILTVIDCFSRFAFAIPLKNKKPESVVEALKTVFKERKPVRFQTDKGGEFIGKAVQTFLNKENVKFFTTSDDYAKASIVERFHLTLKRRMFRYFERKNTKRYLDVLPKLVHAYNNTIHSTTKLAPSSVNEKNYHLVLQALDGKTPTIPKPKLKVGDYVRISRSKATFEKSYYGNWTVEIFQIYAVKKTVVPVYEIKDYNGHVIEGTFYEKQLQKVGKPETFKIQKILKTRKRNGKTEYFVHWLGYPKSQRSWVNDLIKLPKVN